MAAEANNSIAAQFFSPWQPAPAFAEPPAELETAKRIQTTVEYAKRNGRRFVDMIKSKQQDNAQYAFLFGGVGSAYYEWLLYSTLFNLRPERPPPEHAADAAAPQQHGQEAAAAEQQLQQQIAALPAEVASGFTQVLNALNGSKDSIKASQQWFMACAQCCVGMAAMMAQHIRQLTSHEHQLHVIYLANDILLKSHSQRPAGATEQQDAVARALVGVLGGMLRCTIATAGPAAGTDVRTQLDRMLAFWGQKAALTAATLDGLRAEMLTPATPPNGAADAAASPPPWQAPAPMPAPAAPAPWAAPAAPPPMQPPPPHMLPPYPGAAPPLPWNASGLPDRPPWTADTAPEAGAAAPEAAGGGYGHAASAYLPIAAPSPLPPGSYPPDQHPAYPHPRHPAPAPSALEAALAAPPPPPTYNDSTRPPDKPSAASLSFPAGLLPAMVQYKLRTHEPYTPLSARDIQDTPPPRPPKMDEYLSSRLNRFYSELDTWRLGTTRAAFEDNRRRAERRKAKGEADDEEMGGRRRRPGRPREERDKDTGTFADGSVGRGSGSQYAGLGMHSKSVAVRRPEPEEPSDEFESFRKHRAGVYRTTMQSKSAAAQAARMAAPP